jgi:hypothetical protein
MTDAIVMMKIMKSISQEQEGVDRTDATQNRMDCGVLVSAEMALRVS